MRGPTGRAAAPLTRRSAGNSVAGGAPRPAQGAHGAKPRASTPAASPRRQRARRGRENRGGGDAPRDGRAPAQGPGNKGPPWRNKDGRRPQPERGAETPRDRPARAHTSAVPARAHPARAGPAARGAPRGAVSTRCRIGRQCRRRAGGCSAPQPLERKRRGCALWGARQWSHDGGGCLRHGGGWCSACARLCARCAVVSDSVCSAAAGGIASDSERSGPRSGLYLI